MNRIAVGAKDNEITAIPDLLALLSLKGAIVTIDAIGCQKKITAAIRERGANYLLALKENQPTLYRDVADFLVEQRAGDFNDRGRTPGAGQAGHPPHPLLHQLDRPRCRRVRPRRAPALGYRERQAARATRLHPLPHADAVDLITAWTRFRVQEIDLAILEAASEIRAAHRFSYWDSAVIAAARALGCRELYTEDMSHGRQIAGILIVNPFR